MEGARCDLSRFTPEHLFEEYTFLTSDEDMKQVSDGVKKGGAIPYMNYSHEDGCWVFHTMHIPNGKFFRKQVANKFEKKSRRKGSTEYDIESSICEYLENLGHDVSRQVYCGVGRADIVTGTTIYEVEKKLSQQKIFEAIGQVLLYRAAVNPALKAAIIGQGTKEAIIARPYAASFGVEVLIWNVEKESIE